MTEAGAILYLLSSETITIGNEIMTTCVFNYKATFIIRLTDIKSELKLNCCLISIIAEYLSRIEKL